MHPKLKTLKPYLDTLGLGSDTIPTLEEYRQAYRDKFHLHPDKASKDKEKESTKAFQEISEAAREVYAFINENPRLQTRKNTKECAMMIKSFEDTIEYNTNNVVFTIDEKLSEGCKSAFEKRFGAPMALKDMIGCQYKTFQLEISNETKKTFGTFSASVWINPSDGKSKVLLQGEAYMTFLTFIVPDILEEINPILWVQNL